MQKNKRFDVVAVGNAIVDILWQCDDAFLNANTLPKGGMKLISEKEAHDLYGKMGKTEMASGGSGANTIAGIASFGGKTGYMGKVSNDQLGDVFTHDIKATGVEYATTPLRDGLSTARCMIFITPDAERTMCTFLGASTELSERDLDKKMIADASVTYLEGYLFDKPLARKAFFDAAETAHAAGNEVALSLSDLFCVSRHKDEFLKLIKGHVDILFANEGEITALFDTNSFDDAVKEAGKHCKVCVLTRGKDGACIVSDGNVIDVPAADVDKVIDTTGAGDLYASGFLYGYTNGYDLPACGRIASLAAAEIISHVGARPKIQLKELATVKKDWILKG